MPVTQRRCQRQCSQVLVDAYSAPAIRHGKGTRTGATRERGRQPPADGPKPTNRAYAREPRAAPQSHDSRVDCTSGCCDRGASLELLPAHEQIKRARQCHLHAPANRARSPNPTTIARAETRTARQRWPRPTASALAPAHEKQLQCVIQQAPSPRVECAPVIIPGLSRRIRRRRGATTGNHVAYVTVFSKPPVAPIRL